MCRNGLLLIVITIFLSSCKSPEARKPVQRSSGSFIAESAERNKELYEREEALLLSIMESDTLNDYLSSASGFWYYYRVKDSLPGATPRFGDKVTFSYDIRELNGQPILSDRQTYLIDQSNQDMISGIRDGLKLMKAGETVTFLFPSYKAYGYYGIEDKLGSNVPVQSTVTLENIESSEN